MKKFALLLCGLATFAINSSKAQTAPNGTCATAVSLTVGAGCLLQSNTGVLNPAGDYTQGCAFGGDATQGAMWYSFVCPPSGAVTVSTDFPSTTFDTQINILGDLAGSPTSCPATMYEYGCDEDGGINAGGFSSITSVGGLVPGQTYWIQVDGWNGSQGNFCIQVVEVPCNADAGTFTQTVGGVPQVSGSPIYLCNDGGTTCYSFTSNNDFVLPINEPGEIAELFWALYTCAPTVTDPTLDPCWTGSYWTDQDFTDCNPSGFGLTGTYFWVPITADDGDNGLDPNGVVNHDQNGDGCYDLGTPVETVYLNSITTGAVATNCYNGTITVQVFGGQPEADGSNYIFTNNANGTIVTTGTTHGGYIILNGLSNGDAYNISITDGTGCSAGSITGTYVACACPTVDFTYTSPVQCDDPAQTLVADEGAMAPGESITPCYYVQVIPSNAQAGNTIEYFENAISLGTLNVTANTNFSGYLSYVDAAATNTFELCETTAGANMTYMVFDCHSGALITSGTWIADGTGCQTVTVTPPSTNISGTGTWTGTGITVTTNWGAALFDPSVAGAGTHSINYAWDNGNGCSSNISHNIVVQDLVNPTITCPGNQTGNVDASCNFSLPDYTGLATAADNCSGLTVTQSPAIGTNVGVGTTTITLTATDGGSNTATCTFDVVISDLINPTITCPGNQTGNVDASCNFTLLDYTALATAADNCGVVVTQSPVSGTNVGVGTTTITLTATDPSSNTATCTFDVVVTDIIPPTITCPGNQTGNVDASCNFSLPDYTGLATAGDNCPGVTVTQSPVTGTNVGVGTTTITLTATDAAGLTATCTFDVVVTDATAPTITCPGNQTGNVDATCNFALLDYTGLATAGDNCPGVTVTQSPVSGTNVGVGTTTITLTATDGAGLTATCTFDVVVTDNINPTITCPANQTGNVDATCNFSLLDYTGMATANDNCPGVVVTQSPAIGSSVGVGTTTITLTATDASSNTATCTFDVVVTDATAPTITCPGNQTGNVDAACNFALPDYTGLATANDNCPGVVVTQSPAIGSNVGVGTTTITLTATDAAGLTATCTFDVVVTDATAPTITCPGNQNETFDAACSFTLPDYTGLATANDNCGIASVTQSPIPGSVIVGTTTITLTATDVNGLTNTCTFDVVATDVTPPTITCPGNQTGNVDATCNFTLPDYTGLATANDNCSVTVTQSPAIGTNVGVGTTTITLTATDGASLTATCTFDVVVTDVTPPTITCPGNQTGTVDATCNFALPDYTGLATANDNCGVTVTQSPAIGTNVGVGTTTITLTATDPAGLTTTCNFDVVVTDITAPSITCPGNQTETFDATCSFTLPDYTGLATATDNCGIASVTQSPIVGTVISGTTTITLTATDVNGLTSTCTFDVIPNDNTNPTAVCQNISINLDGTGNVTIVAADIDGGSTDNCGAVTLSASQTAFGCADIGPNNVTLTVTDGSSNTATCVAVVTVVDPNVPTVTAGPDDAICEGSTYTLAGLLGGSATSGTWSTSGDGGFSANTDPNAVYTPGPTDISNGTVTLTFLTDASPCATATDDMILTIEETPTFTVTLGNHPTLCGATDGTIVISGLNPSTNYDITYNDGTGTINLGTVTTDGAGDYIITGLGADGYSNFVVTLGNCTTTVNVPIALSDPSAPVFTAAFQQDPTTCGGTDGEIILTGLNASTAYDITYDNGFGTVNLGSVTTDASGNYVITGLAADSYTNFVVTLSGCTGSSSVIIVLTDPAGPTFTVGSPVDPTSCGGTDGTITISGLNPSTNYDITYDDGTGTVNLGTVTTDASGNYVITGLDADNYTNFNVTDGINCNTVDASVITLNDPNAPTFTAAFVSDPTTCGGADGVIEICGLNASTLYDNLDYDNGVGTVNFGSFTTDATGCFQITGLSQDTYDNFNVTLASCVGTVINPITLTDPNAPTFTAAFVSDPTTCGGADGVIEICGLNASTLYDNLDYDNGVGTINFGSFTTDATGCFQITGLSQDTYDNFNVTLAGCTGTLINPITLTDPNAPTFTAAFVSDPTTCGGADGVIEICGLNASTLYDNLDYDNGSGTVNFGSFTTDATGCFQITGLAQDTYDNFNVTLLACTGTVINPITLTDPNAPTFTASMVSDPTTCGGADGVIEICGLNASTLYDNLDYDNGAGTINFGSFTTDATGCFQITGLSADAYTNFVVTLTGCSGTDATIVTLVDPNAPTFTASVVSDPTTCGGADGIFEICGLNPSTLYDNLDYDDGSGTVNFGSFTTDATGCFQVTGLSADTYTNFVVTLTGCVGTVATPITLVDPNAPTFTITFTDPTTCGGSDGTITLSGLQASTNYDLTYDDGAGTVNLGTVTSDASGDFVITGLSTGAYTNFVVSLTGCVGTDNSTITLNDPPTPAAPNAGVDATYCVGDPMADMTAIASLGGTLDWFDDAGLTNQIGTGVTQSPTSTTAGTATYYVTETAAGCTSAPSAVTITIDVCVTLTLEIPTGFTPDGDGVNDVWEIVNLNALYPNNVVTVYNRWGNKIFESNGYVTPWDGTYEGKEMPTASYFFTIDFGDSSIENVTGSVTIIR